MIRAAVLSANDKFHHEIRHHAAEAGIRVELVLRSAAPLASRNGLDVLIVHSPGEWDLESIIEAVGTLAIVVTGSSAVGAEQIRYQDGWAVVPDDDFPVLLAAARAAALGLGVTQADGRDSGSDADDEDDPDLGLGHLGLTPRELDVLNLVASGATNRDIATRLGISDNTVKYHLSGLYSKLNVTRRSEVIFQAMRRGLITL